MVKFLPRSNMIAVLVSNTLQIIMSSGSELKLVQTFTRKGIHTFCVNNAVYKTMTATGETLTRDQICIATSEKTLLTKEKGLFFYDMTINGGQIKFEEEKQSHIIANRPQHLCKNTLICKHF